jgi:hypothetical protein
MILAQKHIGKTMEQNRNPKNKPSYSQLIFDLGAQNT